MVSGDNIKFNQSLQKLPIKTAFSFEYLIDDIEQISITETHPMQKMALDVLAETARVQELRKVISDRAILE